MKIESPVTSASGIPSEARAGPGRLVRSFRWSYAVTSWLLVVAVVTQFLLAGFGVFARGDFCKLAPDEGFGCGFGLHAVFGRGILSLLVLLVLVLSFAARAPRRTVGLTAGLLGLFALQTVLLLPYGVPPFQPLAALHVVNGLLLLFVALRVAGRARRLLAPESSSR